MHDLIRARPLATLVTLSSQGLNANHVPMVLSESPAPFGTLRGHVAHVNPLWRDFADDTEALAIFHGPDAYISPSWYATKKETGRVVPTWNYAVVHAYGRLRVIQDSVWLERQLEALVEQNEAPFTQPWSVTDAPQEYIEKSMEEIMGLEITVTRLQGKWKLSQNQPVRNRAGVVAGLKARAAPEGVQVAELMQRLSDAQ